MKPHHDPHDPNVRLEQLDKRVRKVERRSQTPSAGSGIRFDVRATDPDGNVSHGVGSVGGILEIETITDSGDFPSFFQYTDENANSSDSCSLTMSSAGFTWVSNDGTSQDWTVDVSGDIDLNTSGGGITFTCSGDMIFDPTGHLVIGGLPTTNPGGSNRVWRNAGVLSIT